MRQKRLLIIAFSRRGYELALKIKDRTAEYECNIRVKCSALGELSEKGRVADNMENWLRAADGVVFISACGIAVRLIAPFAKDKRTDCPTVVIDENGRFSISLLAGHMGGANELARLMAEKIGAAPIITTATDGRGLTAVDSFAKRRNMYISDMSAAKKISAALLEGESIGIVSDYAVEGELPMGITDKWENVPKNGIVITTKKNIRPVFENTLLLIPRTIVCGIGCRKNTPEEAIEEAVLSALDENDIATEALCSAASIELKRNETGIIEFCGKYNIPFYTYSAERLNEEKGSFSSSEFVRKITGVDCICERSAICCSGGELILGKRAYGAVTVALAERIRSINFED